MNESKSKNIYLWGLKKIKNEYTPPHHHPTPDI